MKACKSMYLKLTYKDEEEDAIFKPGDSIWIRINGKLVIGEICCICVDGYIDEKNTNLIVRSKNNMYMCSLLDIAKVFTWRYDNFKSLDICYDLFLIDDFNRDPISIGEECLLLEPSIDPDKKFNKYRAKLIDIRPKCCEFNIRYEGEKQSAEVLVTLIYPELHIQYPEYDPDSAHYARFLLKKINKEKDDESI